MDKFPTVWQSKFLFVIKPKEGVQGIFLKLEIKNLTITCWGGLKGVHESGSEEKIVSRMNVEISGFKSFIQSWAREGIQFRVVDKEIRDGTKT